jgi:hypothetical protein
MTEDERCAGEFWWRKHLVLHDGQIRTAVNNYDPWDVHHIAMRTGKIDLEVDGTPKTSEKMVLACIACVQYANANTNKTFSEILGLTVEEPVPAKADIASRLRAVWSHRFERADSAFNDFDRLIRMVESLPSPEKPSLFSQAVEAKIASDRSHHADYIGDHSQAAMMLSLDFHHAILGLLRDHDVTLTSLIDLAATAHRAAEDLMLIGRAQ